MLEFFKKELEAKINLNDDLWEDIKSHLQVFTVSKGEYLLRKNDICRYGYFIHKGSFMHTYINDEGKEFVISLHLDEVYRYLTSPQSFFTGNSSDFEIIALEESKVIAFHKKNLDKLSDEHPEFQKYYHEVTAGGLLYLYQFSTIKMTSSAINFLKLIYQDYPSFLLRIPDKYIARFIGISEEWFSKIKKKFLKEG
ncbi:MAG: Crp/Fnr family transcriptional regulator [Bacteroidales bacterium]|nr:Crp/Fnr family transcriptional regulator [Bacteroidales bacterium]